MHACSAFIPVMVTDVSRHTIARAHHCMRSPLHALSLRDYIRVHVSSVTPAERSLVCLGTNNGDVYFIIF